MKNRITLFLLAVLLLILPVISSAEIKEGSFEINPFVGWHVFGNGDGLKNDTAMGLRLGYNITNRIGVEGVIDNIDTRAWMYHADVLYHFMPEKKLNPFFVGGIGYAKIRPDNRDHYSTLMANLGAGFKYFFSNHVAFRADIRNVITNMQNVAVTAGLTFAFGGKTPKPAPKPEPTPPPPPPAPKPEPTPPPPPPAPKPEPKPIPPPLPTPAPEPVKIILEDIHFDFDKATLTKVAIEILEKNAKTLRENAGVSVQIEGHACAHGAENYNMALSERRANAVKEYLVNQGISSERMTTISYGETRLAMPEIPTPKNKESREAKANRRVHFEVIVK